MDNLSQVWSGFFAQRTRPLYQRFPGVYRGVVVDTNDPLNMRRVRFKIPELHDWDLKPEDCPWAVPAPYLGSRGGTAFGCPCVGDYVWIVFEKGYPYGPVYVGFAPPTRRRYYPLPSIHGRTPIHVDAEGKPQNPITDYDESYLPKDGRPMNHGWQDRYGHLDLADSTGFYPIEHDTQPPPPDTDPLSKSKFNQMHSKPSVNDPDSKMLLRATKYGTIIQQSDIGYQWKLSGQNGEFTGDFDADYEFEIDRWLYLQRLLHEDQPTGHDMRKLMLLTRYGHKIELRDVGWNKTRKGEWLDSQQQIGDGEDQRWLKLRTKGGMLIEACDVGFDPEQDEFIKRPLLEEISDVYLDGEDNFPKQKSDWNQSGDRDMRMIRFVTRSGIKIVLDDRTSNDRNSHSASLPNKEIGMGVLIKGRATPAAKDKYKDASGDPTGFYWQFDERPDRNSTTWGTPLGQAIEMDDNEEFLAICSRIPELPTKWKYLSDNEFLENSLESFKPWTNTHHLIIDHGRELIRLKSRAGAGDSSKLKKLGDAASGEHAGLEIHDAPATDPWVELVDIDDRGLFFSRKDGISIWRAKDGVDVYVWIDDNSGNVVIFNRAQGGKVQIYSLGNIELISERNVSIQANRIDLKANEIRLDAGGTPYTFSSRAMLTTRDVRANNVYAYFPTAERPAHVVGRGIGAHDGGGSPVANLSVESAPSRVKPDNRLV